MGATLTNGIYLPNEGEKNCYAGLKTNWETLDQKIADIAALQQAVAGALHREIVASLPTTDIDPNTIYMILSGTSATENVYNEFMYVNNAWELIGTSATDLTNYYTKGDVDGLLLLKANASDLTSHTGDTTIHVTASDKSKWNTVALIKQLRLVNAQVGSATTIAFANIDDTNGIKVGDKCMDLDAKMFEITAVDTANQTVTVGTALIDLALDSNVVHTNGNETVNGDKTFTGKISSNDYFYGSIAWGLDKANIWTNNNTFKQNIFYERTNFYQLVANPCYILKDIEIEKGDLVSTAHTAYPGLWHDKNAAVLGYIRFVEYSTGRQTAELRVSNLIKNGALDPTGSEVNCTVQLELQPSGEKSLIPELNNDINLGTSANKWKSFNGIIPSSLSLPADSYIDISGYVTNLAGGNNQYTALANGWVYVDSNTTISSVIINNTRGYSSGFIFTGQLGRQRNTLPVCKDDQILINVNCTSLNAVRFIPCQGNI